MFTTKTESQLQLHRNIIFRVKLTVEAHTDKLQSIYFSDTSFNQMLEVEALCSPW